MKLNIKLLLIIIPLYSSWFFLGIWLPYYLLFTNYAGISLIEAGTIIASFLFEIPTGAFSDLFGKKKTLQIAYLFATIGQVMMGISQNVLMLIISNILISLGAALLSGTSDALIYDSLKEMKEEDRFDKILSSIQKYGLIIMAICSFIGGFVYIISPGLPFILSGLGLFLGFLLTFFLKEPSVDTAKFSFKNYLIQNKQGFKQLFKHKKYLDNIFTLLILSSLTCIFIEILDPSLALNFGYSEVALGFLYAIIPLVSAAGAHFYPRLKIIMGTNQILFLIIVSFFMTILISPILGIIGFTSFLLYRNIFYPVIDIISSETINSSVDSKYRATTLSTFTMLKKLPYVLVAFFIGSFMDQYTAKNVSIVVVLIFLLIYLLSKIYFRKTKITEKIS
jgi:MFS family permease